MSTWLLTWNQSKACWDDYDSARQTIENGGSYEMPWICSSKRPKIGEEVYLLKLGDSPKGIIGHGIVIRESYVKEHYDPARAAAGDTANFVDISFNQLVDYNQKIVGQDELNSSCGDQLWSPQNSGIEIRPEVIPTLQSLWNAVIEDQDDWWPSLLEYDPGITAQEYHDLFLKEKIIKRDWLEALYEMYQMEDHLGTCKQMGERYGHEPSHYNRCLTAIAESIAKKMNCAESIREEEDAKFWPVLFQGKSLTDGSNKYYCWRMREPVVKAIEMLIDEGQFAAKENRVMADFNHNMILYGPPGTGKTYKSIIYAVAICDGRTVDDVQREDYEKVVLKRYRELKDAGRIAFTTFHQSYGYEEFIEGIKPKMDSESDTLRYTVEPGVFKAFCKQAKDMKVYEHGESIMKEHPKIWGMILGGTGLTELKKQCLTNNEIRLGWNEVDDDEVEGDFEGDDKSSKIAKQMVFDFINTMEVGDLVVIEKNKKSIDAIGVITGEYEYDKMQESYPRKRSVKWLVKNIDQDMTPFLPNGRKQLSRFSLFAFDYIGIETIYKILNENITSPAVELVQETQPYVFIIDEINRGNLSKIFGELITLIEDTKRDGASEKMEAILPYSGEPFSVPKNVYILGTMNTADRSIALMDTALRRRFEFVEMMPDPEVLESLGIGIIDINGEELNVAKMLDVINKRIEYLFDREHTIGHAFFTKLAREDKPSLKTLAGIFEKKVIPLLQEYFYEDYEKIQLVLGDNTKADGFKFILDKPLNSRDIFNGNADIDLPEKGYSIQREALYKLESYKLIGEDI